jgi:hypothetical protein
MSLELDLDRVRENARRASTEGLLDQVTVYRGEVEAAALEVIEAELAARGVGRARAVAHEAARERDGLTRRPDGTVVRCSFCDRPAVEGVRRWHRLWGWFLPVFPRTIHLCVEHRERPPADPHGRALHHEGEHPGQDEGPAG